MNKIPLKAKLMILAVLIFGVGFFSGMEYKAYQIRSAFKEVADSFSNAFDTDSPSDKKEVTKEAEEMPNKLTEKIDVELLGKDFIPSDYMQGTYQDYITLNIKFINKTDNDIRGVKGVLKLYDIFEKEIFQVEISYDQGVKGKSTADWKGSIDYNQFLDEHEALRNTELKNIKYKWFPDTIIYSDGKTESN